VIVLTVVTIVEMAFAMQEKPLPIVPQIVQLSVETDYVRGPRTPTLVRRTVPLPLAVVRSVVMESVVQMNLLLIVRSIVILVEMQSVTTVKQVRRVLRTAQALFVEMQFARVVNLL